jgi:peptide deformylase
MAIRKIAQIGHPILREPAAEVPLDQLMQPRFQQLIDDLIETMHDANGAGLAATQIYEPWQICAMEVNENPRYPYKPKIPLTVLVNPRIEKLTEETFENNEGCLSVPNIRGNVERCAKIRVTAYDRFGSPIDRVFQGFTAGTMQHEVDHLFGRLFIDQVEDPRTLSTWTEFERFHKEAFMKTVEAVKARWHS